MMPGPLLPIIAGGAVLLGTAANIHAGVREARAARRYAKRQEEAQLRAARAGAVARALSGKYHSGPAFSVIEKGVTPPDMTSIAIQKGLANLASQWGTSVLGKA